ncbi:MAG: hypothetical protein M1840_004035 [Geoglossum simile]|nr:MAG: hypothetical protein M1840_004035 [Geoglossum simile]
MDPPTTIVIGVDLGQTCTGVAFATPTKSVLRKIQDWPGRNNEAINKVRTAVAYRAGGLGIHSWGFECPAPNDVEHGMAVKANFKLFLDESYMEKAFRDLDGIFGIRPRPRAPNIKEVQLWCRDFLSELYVYITDYLEKIYTRSEWDTMKVEYLFSVPTTWGEESVIMEYREIVKEAGFGAYSNDSVIIGLTEAEASAVYTAMDVYTANNQQHQFQKGNILFVCDAGGGTTDTAVMRVVSVEGDIPKLEEVGLADCVIIGSVQIDEAFGAQVEARLNIVRGRCPTIKYNAVETMVKGKFQDFKTGFGHLLGEHSEYIIDVPGLQDYSDERARIRNGKMVFSHDEIKGMFDIQISGIFSHVDQQLGLLKQEETVSYFILCGGLGSSAYVQQRFTSRYGDHGAKVLTPDDPYVTPILFSSMLIELYRQLAVCKGLVANRIQHLKSGASVLLTRRCCASYGILLNEPYNKTKHRGQKRYKSPLDGTEYVTNQIDWFIIRGEPIIEGKHITRRYSRIVSAKNPNKVWKDKIMVSRLPPDKLPHHITQGGAKVVFKIVSDLQSGELDSRTEGVTKRHKHWWLSGAYLQIDHEVAITIGPAGLSFWIRMGERAHHEDNALFIEWARSQDGVAGAEAAAVDESAEKADGDEWRNSLIRNPVDPPQ